MKRNLITLLLSFFVVAVFAQAPPTPTIASQTCGTVVLEIANPPSGVTYYWQGTSCGTIATNSDSTYEVTTSGTIYVRYYVNTTSSHWYGCSTFSVNVPVPPLVPAITTNLNILSYIPPSPSQANVIYLWQGTSCGNSLLNDSVAYLADALGVYYLTAYDTLGNCWADSCTAATVVGQNEYQLEANVFPNPSNGLFSVELERTESNVELKVYDLFGRVIYSEEYASFNKEAIDLSSYAKGMYILNLKNKSFTLSKQMIIE
jgi:Secretion system C-terminal sorting domain